ncbi:MmgE/PrpD family protein [Aliiroseovarius subalbicans]|uniref:MmgE/PrpD family protein n=1 Tax=Aliiroseovarius subalbicans TaxID=2925840 RepID=UPI001F582DA4|nr:MmgE/PrpD family protein [Aliiroseovarius subalbicans]MCI2398007.1 MmgE/PrpD family protein [Aliiroseovarius subalbicans]
MTPLDALHRLTWTDIPAGTQTQVKLNLLDLIGVGLGGASTRASRITRDFASAQTPGRHALLFDGRAVSAPGLAHAGAATIDALDGHDGFNPAKGHAGCATFPAAFAFALETGNMDGAAFLTALTLGYEFACRLATALHDSAPDYHTSGAWAAVACAGIGARYLELDPDRTRHAMGIAEYHGPRSQMMRCIDHPTMVKDGSGWGAMAGVSAALLAQAGFTGAPALTLEQAPDHWADLGNRWLTNEQYYKPYPVCRWAQAPVEAVLALRQRHGVTAADVDHIQVETFHESVRLATSEPNSTDEAQYSTSFPVAVAMVRGDVTPADLTGSALRHPEVLRLSRGLLMTEDDAANAAFPATRLARATLVLRDGSQLHSDWHEPKWDATAPPSEADLRAKFHGLAAPLVGTDRASAIEAAIDGLPADGLGPLAALITQPINA